MTKVYTYSAYDSFVFKQVEISFNSLEELAIALWRKCRPTFSYELLPSPLRNVSAYSFRGRELSVPDLIAYGRKLVLRQRMAMDRSLKGYVRRRNSVYGVHKCRYRRSTSNVRVGNWLRTTNVALVEEGEVPVRAARALSVVREVIDFDKSRHRQRSWKKQHKGKKAWDKPVKAHQIHLVSKCWPPADID